MSWFFPFVQVNQLMQTECKLNANFTLRMEFIHGIILCTSIIIICKVSSWENVPGVVFENFGCLPFVARTISKYYTEINPSKTLAMVEMPSEREERKSQVFRLASSVIISKSSVIISKSPEFRIILFFFTHEHTHSRRRLLFKTSLRYQLISRKSRFVRSKKLDWIQWNHSTTAERVNDLAVRSDVKLSLLCVSSLFPKKKGQNQKESTGLPLWSLARSSYHFACFPRRASGKSLVLKPIVARFYLPFFFWGVVWVGRLGHCNKCYKDGILYVKKQPWAPAKNSEVDWDNE